MPLTFLKKLNVPLLAGEPLKITPDTLDPKTCPLGLAFAIMSAKGLWVVELSQSSKYAPEQFPKIEVHMQLQIGPNSGAEAIHELHEWAMSNGKNWG